MPMLFPNVAGSLGTGGPGTTLLSPWVEITGRSVGTWYENTAANAIVSLVRVQGNNDTAHSDFHARQSADGVNSDGDDSVDHTEDLHDEIRLVAAIPAGQYEKIDRGGAGANTAYAIDGWLEQEITGAADDFADVTGSRALETSYQNTTGDPIFVLAACTGNNDSGISIYRFQTSPDNSVWTDVFGDKTENVNNWFNSAAVVPDTYYYRITKASGSNTAAAVSCWVEKRLTGSAGALEDVTASRALATAYTNNGSGKLAVHVMLEGNNDTAKSRFVLETSPDGSSWTTDDGDITENGKDGVFLLGLVAAGDQYRVVKESGSNTSYALESWLEQEIT